MIPVGEKSVEALSRRAEESSVKGVNRENSKQRRLKQSQAELGLATSAVFTVCYVMDNAIPTSMKNVR